MSYGLDAFSRLPALASRRRSPENVTGGPASEPNLSGEDSQTKVRVMEAPAHQDPSPWIYAGSFDFKLAALFDFAAGGGLPRSLRANLDAY